ILLAHASGRTGSAALRSYGLFAADGDAAALRIGGRTGTALQSHRTLPAALGIRRLRARKRHAVASPRARISLALLTRRAVAVALSQSVRMARQSGGTGPSALGERTLVTGHGSAIAGPRGRVGLTCGAGGTLPSARRERALLTGDRKTVARQYRVRGVDLTGR